MLGLPLPGTSRAAIKRLVPIAQEYMASGATMLFSAICQFAWFIILARYLGVVEFGFLMVMTAICTLASSLCGVGAGDAVLRHTARDRRSYPELLGHGLLVITATGLILSIVSVLVLQVILGPETSHRVGIGQIALFAFANIWLASLISFSEYIFLGLGELPRANLIEIGFAFVRLMSAVIGCALFGAATLGEWAVWTTGAHLIMLAVCVAMLKPFGWPVWQINRHELALGFHYCTPRMLDALRVNCDRIVLGIVAPANVLATYAVAARITQVSQIVVNSLNRIVYPRFASRKEFGFRSIRPMAIAYLSGVTGIATLTAAGVYMIAPFLPVLIGKSYESVIFNLRVLCWLIVPLAMQTVPYDLLGAFDRHRARAILYNTMSLAGASLTAAMIYHWGISGAFTAAYVVETGLAAGLWGLVLHLARTEAPQPPLPERATS